jgi:metal-responsive CopG/Arc/MetJ family transcriptional regulator
MAKTPSSSVSESVTLRIPNELYAQIKAYADSHSRGNRSQAIVQLLETGLDAVSNQSSEPLQDNQLQVQVSETQQTVAALSEQVSQLNQLVQDSVLQRLTVMEAELGELSA